MTAKIYKSAQGKTVDMGTLFLQNENIRAVGNMGVNARGDLLDGSNTVIDQKNRQAQRQYQRQTNVSSSAEVHTSNRAAKQALQDRLQTVPTEPVDPIDVLDETLEVTTIQNPAPVDPVVDESVPQGGLAAAIARARTVRQELEKTPRQLKQEQPLRKI